MDSEFEDRASGFRPFVAIPSLHASIATVCARGLLGLSNLAWERGFPLQVRFLEGDSLIPRARNRLVAEFMADRRWTHLLWIDSDIGFTPAAVERLADAGKDVVAGIYPMKTEHWPEGGLREALPAGTTRADFERLHARFPYNPLPQPAGADARGYLEVRHAPTGFMLVARSVLDRMAAAYPELRYAPGSAGPAGSVPHYRFFDVLAEPGNGAYLSEDFAFCERWRRIGGKVHIDARSDLVHVGIHSYTGRLA